MDHLTSNSLLSSHQSAYCKHHSTETALLYIHDNVISATGSQKVSCLCLLDLSAAIDTIDHDILITRLSSWFVIHGSVLSWFVISDISLRPCQKPVHIILRCPPIKGSVPGPLGLHHSCQYPYFLLFPKPLVAWLSGRTSISGRRTFPVLRSTCS